MKKRFIAVLVFFPLIFSSLIFAQNSAASANRNTALRCLRLAENCLVGGDWENAFRQAELGLSYDDSVSDLIYVKAASAINLSYTKSAVLDIIREAFKKDNWLGYSQNGARILYADLLCDTGDYESSLKLLDSEPFILSADAEFIRIKNYYRMGTQKSLSEARIKVNTARRIYPKDSRFPTIFFMFEYAFMSEAFRSGLHYEMDETVQTVARAYIAKLPDYTDLENEVEIYASFFTEGEEGIRLLRAIDAKKSRSNPLLAIEGLRRGIYSEAQAYDLFFSSLGEEIPLEILQEFALELKSDGEKLKFAEFLTAFSGIIRLDLNLDLQSEIKISYENGRPSSVIYDADNDGENELIAQCDFGAPTQIIYPGLNIIVSYSAYPELSSIAFENEGRTFTFLHDDYRYTPFEFTADSVLTLVGVDFFVPRVITEIALPVSSELVEVAAGVEVPNQERNNSKVLYSSEKGKLYFASFYEGERRYAYSDFSAVLPFLRHVDSDDDGYFETTEEYSALPENAEGFDLDAVKADVERIFGINAFSSNICLKKISIDRNANTHAEYSEEYYEYGGKMCSWDNDDDGNFDYFYIKSPHKEGNPLEETYIFAEASYPAVWLNFIDGIPVKMTVYNSEEMIYAGNADNFYWISEEGSEEMEKLALKAAEKLASQGISRLVEADGKRFSIIKVSGNIFARILPDSYMEEE